jgi:hypothetical protein
MKDYISFLQNAIQKLHGVKPEHAETVSVTERFQGQTVWDGEVEIFQLPAHSKAEKIYAWGYTESDDKPDMKAVTVLALPPITTPQKAVQAFIASQYRKEQSNERE